MVNDPRRRNLVETNKTSDAMDITATSTGTIATDDNSNNGNNQSILFAGDDGMDEDEDLFDSSDALQDEPMQQTSGAATTASSDAIDNSAAGASYFGTSSSVLNGRNDRINKNLAPHRYFDLVSTIISPSPFAHHSAGGTGSSRYRNALTRIGADPRSDVEAWGALLAEASSCWKLLFTQTTTSTDSVGDDISGGGGGGSSGGGGVVMQVVHVNIAARTSAETQLQLDWIESCYGAFLKYFPYSCCHIRAIGDILFVQSALVGEEGGPATDYGQETPGTMSRSQQAQWKLETLLQRSLGVDLEGESASSVTAGEAATIATTKSVDDNNDDNKNNINNSIDIAALVGGMCTPSIELWLLYIKTRIRQIKRIQNVHGNKKNNNNNSLEAAKAVLEDSKKAYELALEFSGFTCHDNNLLWKEYLSFCKASVPPVVSEREQNAALLIMTPKQHMMWLRDVYQKLVCHPMTGLDQLWQEYENFEKSQSEALAAALIAEWQPKYQHARNIYLERNKTFSIQDLQWKTRLAVPPVSTTWIERLDAKRDGRRLCGGIGGVRKNGSGVAGVSGDKKKKIDDDAGFAISEEALHEYQKKLRDEFEYLTLWKKRCAYERTNPERIANPQELAHRIRQAYKEMVCVLTLYPEVWHMWSMWEDTLATSSGATAKLSSTSSENLANNRSIAVLQIGQRHILDSTLLVQAHVQLVEAHAMHCVNGNSIIDRGSLLGSMKASHSLEVLENYLARAPTSLGFCLYERLVRRYKGIDAARAVFSRARRVLHQGFDQNAANSGASSNVVRDQIGVEGASALTTATKSGGSDPNAKENLKTPGTNIDGNRCMVTNRLDPSIGKNTLSGMKTLKSSEKTRDSLNSTMQIPPGPITWHLYACHATIEHRLNKSPEIAARVYELGLRKHSNFLTKPSYVLKYAKLLLELQDTVNLRALLTRSLAACGDSRTSEEIEALWNMTLQCEELWSISEPANIEAVIAIERKRRVALLGPHIEDVSTGSRVGLTEKRTTISSQKSTLAEQLIRVDGYNTSSLIVNGLGRTVDVLDITGLWGDGSGGKQYHSKSNLDKVDELIPGGISDRSFQSRLQFVEKLAAGINVSGIVSGLEHGSKLSSARERLHQQAGGGPGFQNTPIQISIQQNPEWLRSMLLLLPASRLRSPIVPKAPPHLVVQALTTLRQSKLPEERPKDDAEKKRISGKKRALGDDTAGGGDSSDEDGPSGSGGYGSQFRARMKMKQG